MSDVGLNSPQPNHLFPTILRKSLRILNFLIFSSESLSICSLSVTIAAALYTKKVTNGGRELKSIDCVPIAKSSTTLVIAETTEIRDVVAIKLQLSFASEVGGTLVPFSNARRRALF